jgi:hypothetical protein
MICLFTEIGFTPVGSTTVHINTNQYTEKHYETEYTEYYINNNKNTYT